MKFYGWLGAVYEGSKNQGNVIKNETNLQECFDRWVKHLKYILDDNSLLTKKDSARINVIKFSLATSCGRIMAGRQALFYQPKGKQFPGKNSLLHWPEQAISPKHKGRTRK